MNDIQKFNKTIHVKVSNELREDMKVSAKTLGMSVSSYLRSLHLFSKQNKNNNK